MKLLTNSHNINALKIITVAEFCDTVVNIEVVSENASCNVKLPTLETSDGFRYFSSNAASRYIFVKSGRKLNASVDDWLEWESSVLQPYVSKHLESKGPSVFKTLESLLTYLDSVLSKHHFLSSDSIDLAGIVVWSSLYPLFHFSIINEFSNFSNIGRWFDSLKAQKFIVSAVSKVFGSIKGDILKESLVYHSSALPIGKQKYFMPVHIEGFSFPNFEDNPQNLQSCEDEVEKEPIFSNDEMVSAYASWLKSSSALPPPRPVTPVKLPVEGERNILITSALPYVNNVPHLGNIIGAVLSADVFARYCRLRNYNTLYICGTDEYGTATETKAIEMGVTPKEICDKYNKLHCEIYDWFNISFDYFGRTTTEQQTLIAQDIFTKLHNRNLLLEETVAQLYCETCKRFLADRFVEGTCPFCLYEDARGDQCDKCGKLINAPELKQPQCKVCRSPPHLKTSKHLFLDLPKIEPKLKEYLDNATETGQWSNTAKVITYSWLREGLKPRCITRDLKWGTPVPLDGYTNKVFYVWFDAPIGYLSITANYTDQWKKWWHQPDLVQLYNFMAKDNVPFHSIIFPACLLGTNDNYTIVKHLGATEYLNYEDAKFSKSRGVGVFGDDAKETGIPSDIWRFYLLYLRPENQDTFFSWNDLMLKNNSELLNNLGNFINRALMFVTNNFGGVIPEMKLGDIEKLLLAQIGHQLTTYINCMEKTKLRDAIKPILNISRLGNQYIQSNKPWELIKGDAQKRETAGTVLGLSANIACLLCTLMEPYMPETSTALKLQLNTAPEYHILIPEFVCLLKPGHQLGKPSPLFKKIDQDFINKLKEKFAGKQSPEKNSCSTNVKSTNAVNMNGEVNGQNAAEIEKLNTMVSEQGNKVRILKSNKASKADIDKEVSILLELKKKLAIASGENPDIPKGKSKTKKR